MNALESHLEAPEIAEPIYDIARSAYEAGAEIEDTQGDGDISRGRFLGPTGNATPGTLNDPRFLHAAALVPKDATMLVLFGGSGGPDSAQSYEVFDSERSGGPGVYDNAAARLGIPREWPSAVTLENSIWVFGGGIALDFSLPSDNPAHELTQFTLSMPRRARASRTRSPRLRSSETPCSSGAWDGTGTG